jgi:DNA-binding IclR family transcriptional regulator
MVGRGSQGVEVVSRVGDLLRAVGSGEPAGVSTTDVGRSTGMARPTVHRLLTSLAREGLVDRDAPTGRWHLGPELYLLGTTAAARYDIGRHARPVVHELAEATGESAFLSARRGDETVCLLGEDGSFPLRSHVLREGIRFPLGVASAGLAILAHLPDRELESFLARADLVADWGPGHDVEALAGRVRETRTAGYATNPGLVVEGSWGMAAAVFDRSGSPAWALSLTGVESRFRADRRPELGRMLLDRAHRLTRALQGTGRAT